MSYEVWSAAPNHPFSLKRDKIAYVVDARSLCDQLGRDGMVWELIDSEGRVLIETNAPTLPNPVTVQLDSPNGPKIIYPRNSAGEAVEAWCPEGWTIDWETTPAQCGIGYLASPLVPLKLDLGLDSRPTDFRDDLLGYLQDIAGDLAGDCTVERFLDIADDGFDEALRSCLVMGADREAVMLAYGFILGACTAMKIPMSEMFINEGIDLSNLESSH